MNRPITTKLAILLAIVGQVGSSAVPSQAAMPPGPTEAAATQQRMQIPASIADVALDRQGLLHGQILDPQGQRVSRVPVTIVGNGITERSSITDEQGCFHLKLDRGGVYRLQAAGGTAMYRVWSSQAAPPSAGRVAMIITGDPALRGQGSPVYSWISEHPWCFYTLLATAIAVPVVIVSANHNDDSSS